MVEVIQQLLFLSYLRPERLEPANFVVEFPDVLQEYPNRAVRYIGLRSGHNWIFCRNMQADVLVR